MFKDPIFLIDQLNLNLNFSIYDANTYYDVSFLILSHLCQEMVSSY